MREMIHSDLIQLISFNIFRNKNLRTKIKNEEKKSNFLELMYCIEHNVFFVKI